jgi:hypothetical protein
LAGESITLSQNVLTEWENEQGVGFVAVSLRRGAYSYLSTGALPREQNHKVAGIPRLVLTVLS